MTIPLCSRTGDILEPMLKEQWFVKVEDMFKQTLTGIQENKLKLVPNWRINLWNQYVTVFKKDWCISRQLWWGQQIPAYKCVLNSDITKIKWFAARNLNEAKSKAIEYFKSDHVTIEQGVMGFIK